MDSQRTITWPERLDDVHEQHPFSDAPASSEVAGAYVRQGARSHLSLADLSSKDVAPGNVPVATPARAASELPAVSLDLVQVPTTAPGVFEGLADPTRSCPWSFRGGSKPNTACSCPWGFRGSSRPNTGSSCPWSFRRSSRPNTGSSCPWSFQGSSRPNAGSSCPWSFRRSSRPNTGSSCPWSFQGSSRPNTGSSCPWSFGGSSRPNTGSSCPWSLEGCRRGTASKSMPRVGVAGYPEWLRVRIS